MFTENAGSDFSIADCANSLGVSLIGKLPSFQRYPLIPAVVVKIGIPHPIATASLVLQPIA